MKLKVEGNCNFREGDYGYYIEMMAFKLKILWCERGSYVVIWDKWCLGMEKNKF